MITVMETKNVNITYFNVLNAIARAHDITQMEWASVSPGMSQSRISELVALSKAIAENDQEKIKRIRRECTLGKVRALTLGLRKLIGASLVNKELLAEISKEPDQDVRIEMLSKMFTGSNVKKKNKIEAILLLEAQDDEED